MKHIRSNSLGLTYELDSDRERTIVTLKSKVNVEKKLIFNMPIEEMCNRWYKWQMLGKFIQEAFSNCSAAQREFLMTGITPEEWNELFQDEE